jgi:alpha-glucosidase
VLGNHDRPRIAARVGGAQARVAAMLLLTLRGTPTLYYGDELGIGDVAIPADQVQDPRELREPGLGFGRDPVRTPMPWDGSANAGFTTGAPWLPLNTDWPRRNVAVEVEDAGSLLVLHRELLALRRAHKALAIGDVRLIEADGDVLAYERIHEGERIVVVLNLGGETQPMPASEPTLVPVLSTLSPRPSLTDLLAPNEGRILLAQD